MADKNGWISVKKKLPDPKEYDWVLCAVKTCEFDKGKNYYLIPQIYEYRNGCWRDTFGLTPESKFEEVTHWQPLPEPPNCRK
jgi:hypothetical protein